jgi:hypothetical protein
LRGGFGGDHGRPPKKRKRPPAARRSGLGRPAFIRLVDGVSEVLGRLHAISELLACSTDELQAASVSGVGRILYDLHGQVEKLLIEAEEVRR